jgi:hypothetical protein
MEFTFEDRPGGKCEAFQHVNGRCVGSVGEFPSRVDARLYCFRIIADEDHAKRMGSSGGSLKGKLKANQTRRTIMEQWKSVPGVVSVELRVENGALIEVADEEIAPDFILPYIPDGFTEGELVIEFSSTGYNRPASMYGGPDRMGWDREGDDERTLDVAYLWIDEEKVNLPHDIQNTAFDHYESWVEEADLEEVG